MGLRQPHSTLQRCPLCAPCSLTFSEGCCWDGQVMRATHHSSSCAAEGPPGGPGGDKGTSASGQSEARVAESTVSPSPVPSGQALPESPSRHQAPTWGEQTPCWCPLLQDPSPGTHPSCSDMGPWGQGRPHAGHHPAQTQHRVHVAPESGTVRGWGCVRFCVARGHQDPTRPQGEEMLPTDRTSRTDLAPQLEPTGAQGSSPKGEAPVEIGSPPRHKPVPPGTSPASLG